MTNKDNYIFELSDQVVRKTVSYKNRYGITIAADLYTAKDMNMEEKHAAEPKELLVIPDTNRVELYDKLDKIPFDKLETFFRANM